ncbi:hypothetical protein TNCV_5088481 [Trichonephila clavipes]|nr:hypothetical protein TNCV_5088481 [Trichonephila clavipes]
MLPLKQRLPGAIYQHNAQCSASHGNGSPPCYYFFLACPIPRLVSNRAYVGSFGTRESDIDASEKATITLDVRRLPTTLKTSKKFLRRFGVSPHRSLHVKRRPICRGIKEHGCENGYQKCFDATSDAKSVLLLKDLISKEDVFQQFN